MGKDFHELANIFPMMAVEEFAALKQDIAENGMREAIWLHPDGRIIDGRNRYRACEELGIAPVYRTWDSGGSLLSFVVSLNLRRRHLTSGQKAILGAKLKPLFDAEAKARQVAAGEYGAQGGRGNGKPLSKDLDKGLAHSGDSAQHAAKAVGTNREYVSQSETLLSEAPDLAVAVETGAKSLPQANRELKKRKKSEAAAARAALPPEPEAPFVHLYVTEAQHLHMLDDKTVDIIITSPPYNLGDDTWPMGGNGNTSRKGIEYSAHADNMEQCEYERWQVEVFQELYRVAKVGASFFYNHKPRTVSGRIIHPVQWLCNPANPWTVRQEIIWDRKSTHNHSASLFWPHDERIYWMTKGRPELNGESIGMPTIWQEFGPVAGTWHPAPFTLELPRMLLRAIHAAPGAVVLDPFAGSCTTLKAALELGCVAVGVDIEREYLLAAAQESGWRHAL